MAGMSTQAKQLQAHQIKKRIKKLKRKAEKLKQMKDKINENNKGTMG